MKAEAAKKMKAKFANTIQHLKKQVGKTVPKPIVVNLTKITHWFLLCK